jgi:membrane-associated PAP2 superfamily phosphatase
MPWLDRARWLLLWLGLPFIGIFLWDITPGDLAVMRWYGSAQGFPWREQFWLATALHNWPQRAGLLLLAACVLAIWHPRSVLKHTTQRERLWLAAVVFFCALLIPAIKLQSNTSCPWELSEFGGTARYVWHFTFTGPDGGPAKCFPSGHASTFFSFLPAFWLIRRYRPKAAWIALAVVCSAGMVLSWGQVVRGAHFPSHLLWTGWLCWAVGVVASPWLGPPRQVT